MFNKLDTYIKNIDLEQHSDLIESGLNKALDILNKQEIFTLVMMHFRRLFTGADRYDHKNEMHRIIYLVAIIIRPEILLYEKKIEQWLYELRNEWFEYLFNRILPYLDHFSNQILKELYSDYPFGDIEVFRTTAERILYNIYKCKSEENYHNYLFNEKIHPWARILEFENHFRFEYSLFLIRCAYFSEEMSKFEGRIYKRKLTSIFQLYESNGIKPKSKEIIKHLKRLQKIRNAIAHPERAGIRYIAKTHKVKIMEYNPQKREYLYDEEITIPELWDIGYILTIFDRTFVDVTLALSLIKNKINT